MALKAYEGFDHYNSASSDMLARFGWLQWTFTTSSSIQTPGVSDPGNYWQGQSNNNSIVLSASYADNLTTFFVGQRVYMSQSNTWTWHGVDNSVSKDQVQVIFSSATASVQIQSGTGTVLATSNNNVFPVATWFYAEIGATIDGTSGSCTVKINGVQVVTYSGVLKNGSTTVINGHNISTTGNTVVKFRDIYICDDTTGSGTYAMDTFLTSVGDPRVWYGPPNANSSVAFTPLTGTNHGEVAETAMDSDTSYNSSSTVDDVDLFTTTDFPTMSVVLAVGVIGAYRKDNSGSRNMSNELKSGTTTVNGTSQPLNASYFYFQDFWVEDPNTSASWTVSNAQAVTFGYKLES